MIYEVQNVVAESLTHLQPDLQGWDLEALKLRHPLFRITYFIKKRVEIPTMFISQSNFPSLESQNLTLFFICVNTSMECLS